ncbi:hypothetical protein B0H14DRAFT_2622829 [Mycena olivaceomarginata]|nr:hypothetical protein B0H14DRAFT_2622829 [Mycena olivaceomarginata]
MTQETPTAPRPSAGPERNHAAMAGDDNTGSDNDQGAGAALRLNLALPNQNVIVESKPGFELSSDLETNIQKYAPPFSCLTRSVHTRDKAPQCVFCVTFTCTPFVPQEVIKRLRFDIPVGLESIPTDWGKVVSYAEFSLTQRRSKIKKAIRSSVKFHEDKITKKVTYANDSEHQNIFELTTAIVKGTQCVVNVTLGARVALMRKVYFKNPGSNFWDKLDFKLENIHNDADGDAKKLVRAFRHVLEQDQAKHGKKNYKDSDIEGKVDPFQQKVDDIIDIKAMDAATSAQDQSGDA